MALLACFAQLVCRRRFVDDASAGAVSTAICVPLDVLTNLPVVITEQDPLKRPADDHVPGFPKRIRRRFRERRCCMEIVGDRRLIAGTRPWKIRCRRHWHRRSLERWRRIAVLAIFSSQWRCRVSVGMSVRSVLVLVRTA
eukprot:2113998-Pleurochrysis_carterae.AAC.2